MCDHTPSVIFISGVHGVGKTTFSKVVSDVLGIPTYSAGNLIGNYIGKLTTNDKKVADVSGNQDILVHAVRSLNIEQSTIILDGHFCVRNAVGNITSIPQKTFELLKLKLAIILNDDPSIIRTRLEERFGTNESIEQLALLQQAENQHGFAVAEAMEIPILTLKISETDKAIHIIKSQFDLKDII